MRYRRDNWDNWTAVLRKGWELGSKKDIKYNENNRIIIIESFSHFIIFSSLFGERKMYCLLSQLSHRWQYAYASSLSQSCSGLGDTRHESLIFILVLLCNR